MNTNTQSIQTSTKLTQKLALKTSHIHKILSKIGYPHIPLSLTKQTQQQMHIYYQATDSRLQLLQWLIASIYPGYKLDIQYKNCYDDDPHQYKIKKLSIILWKLGVMPMSKFTKNLDYGKYVEGLLGYQSAVNLVYDLVELADSKFSPNISKIQQVAAGLLGDLIRNNSELVNVQYDPYGVTFPSKYYKNREQDQKQVNQQYQQLVSQLKQQKQTSNTQPTTNTNTNTQQQTNNIFQQLQTYKQLFQRKYQKLNQTIQQTIQKYKNLVPQNDSKQISQLHNHRMLDMSRNLCKSYTQYKKMLRDIKQQDFRNKVKDMERDVIGYIGGINQIVDLV